MGGWVGYGHPGGLSTEWQLGAKLQYPIFTGGGRSSAIARAGAQADAAREQLLMEELLIQESVDAAVTVVNEIQSRVRAMTRAVEHLTEVARIEQLALDAGAGTQTDYLRAEADLSRARAALVETRHAEIAARVELARVTGELNQEWLVAVILVLRFVVFPSADDASVIVASGTVEATQADLGFQIPGRIEQIDVHEGDAVTRSSELAWLDRTELQARKAAAEAQVGAARAVLRELESGARSEEIAQARSALAAAEQNLTNANRDFERTKRLHDGGAVSRQVLDHQETAMELAQAEYDRTREQLQIVETGPRVERIAAQRAIVAQARASAAQMDAALNNAVIAAPFDGLVTIRHREPGEVIPAGAPVLTIINPDDRWVRIYVRQDQVGRVKIGQDVTITADSYRDREYQGRVIFIASEAEFTPRNVQTTAERVKLVYRVKVQITGDQSFDLKPGLAADVRLDTESE
jgi:HlyD family secretion protein